MTGPRAHLRATASPTAARTALSVCDVVDAVDEIGGGPTQTSFYGAAAERFMEGLGSA